MIARVMMLPLRARVRTLSAVSAALAIVAAAPRAGGVRPARAQSSAEERALPERAAFLARVRANLLKDQEIENQYTYLERDRKLGADKSGKRRVEEEKIYEVYPDLEPDRLYRRLISVDGKPVPDSQLAREDRKRREQVEKAVARRAAETPGDKARRLKKEAEEQRDNIRRLDDALNVLDVRLTGRETVNGTPLVVATFSPRAGARPATREAKAMAKLKGRALISEADAQIVRVEFEVLDTISLGFGLLARVNTGSRATFERRFVNAEVWLPAAATIQATGRAFLVKGIRVDREVEWSEYKKFVADARIISVTDSKR